jgi:hypothetical protein
MAVVTTLITMVFCCEDEERRFKSTKQRDMCLRLHKKKCKICREWEFSETTSHTKTKTGNSEKELQEESMRDNIRLGQFKIDYKK